MAAIGRQDDGLATFGNQRSGLAFECDMADDATLAVARHRRDEFAVLDLVPVAAGREHLRVHVVTAVDFEEAARDSRRVVFLRQLNETFARRRRHRRCG
jgi:hypothetical protein